MRSLTVRRSAANAVAEPHGYVHISGEFALVHRSEIRAVLLREEQRAHRDCPSARIVACDDDGSGGMLVTTTTEHLAHRLGRSLQEEIGGEVHHGFSLNNKLALVWWRR